MKNSRQTTFRGPDGEKVTIKARRIANGINFRYSVNVNGIIFKVGIPIIDVDSCPMNGIYNTLGLAMDKGFAKWLKATK
tara:strand:+ start:865 stop:1101 length:237 start_codon:yes stop_codon:yes gene_type:complete